MGIKITELDSATTPPDDSDVFVFVDVSANETKQVSYLNLKTGITGSGTSTSSTVVATSVNSTYYLSFTNTDNGVATINADTNLTYNPSTNTLTAGFFSGDGSQLTGVLADSAERTTQAYVNSVSTGTYYPTLASSTGYNTLGTDTNLSFDAATNTLTTGTVSATFVGDGSGLTNLPISGSGSTATTVNTVATNLNATHYVMFSASSSGVDSVNTDTNLTYNASTNTLTAGTFSGAFSGNGSALTNITVSYADSSGVTNQVKLSATTSTDATTYPVLVGNNSTTAQNVFIDNATLSYDASTNTLSATNFSGSGTLITDVAAETIFSNAATSGTYYLMSRAATTGDDSVHTVSSITCNAATGALSATSFVGSGAALTKVAAETVSANAATTGVYYPMVRGATTGDDSVHTHSAFTYNVGTATLTATNFSGNGSAITNVAASTATTATNATNVAITSVSTNANFFVHFGSASSGNDGVDVDADLLYNPSSNILYIDADNGKLVLGEDADIEYYHSGTHGYIDINTGSLYIRDNVDSVHSLFDITTGNLHVDGDVIAYSTTITSDPKLKYDITPLENSLNKVCELNGVSWRWKNNDMPSAGVISTDVKKVLPEAVSVQTALNSNESYETVNYDAIIGLLVESIKELKKEIDELKSR